MFLTQIKLKLPTINIIRTLVLYLIVFTFPYDRYEMLHFGGLNLNELLCLLYLALGVLVYKRAFTFNKKNRMMLVLVVLWGWLFTMSVTSSVIYQIGFDLHHKFLGAILLFYMIFNDIALNPKIKRNMFIVFSITMLGVLLLLVMGYGIRVGSTGTAVDSIEGLNRVRFFGLNPNMLGNYGVLATVFSLALAFEYKEFSKYKLQILSSIPFYVILVGYSGSAGAFLGLFMAIGLFFLFRKTNYVSKLKYILACLILSLLAFGFLSDFEYIHEKINNFTTKGETSGRTELWAKASILIADKPIVGYGKIRAEVLFKKLTNVHHTAHNVFVDIFMWGGIIGFGLYFAFYILGIKQALLYRSITGYTSSLTLILLFMFFMFKSGGGFANKYMWLFVASVFYYPQTPKKQNT